MHRDFDYVIVGGGMAADSAAHGIRDLDAEGSIAILGEEPTAPFPRPALSKKLWTDDDFTVENTALDTAGETGAELFLGQPVTALNLAARAVHTGDDTFGYTALLLATGGHPSRIDGLEPGERVLYFRTLRDYEQLRQLADDRPRVLVVGGGYIGTELAAALVQEGCEVVMIHPDDVINGSKFPPAQAAQFEQRFVDAGVELVSGRTVERGRAPMGDGQVYVELDDGRELSGDVVVIGLGVEPATAVAEAAGLELADDHGVVVDEHLATSAAGVWAAGDVASYPDKLLGRSRIEHVDNATTMGETAGRIMAGSEETYDHTPYFYSEVFGLRYEAVGTLDASLETNEEPGAEDGSSIVAYRDGGAVVGVLLWDVSGDDDDARDRARAMIDRSS